VKKSKDFPQAIAAQKDFEKFFCDFAKKHLHFFVKYATIEETQDGGLDFMYLSYQAIFRCFCKNSLLRASGR